MNVSVGMLIACALFQAPPAKTEVPEHLAHPKGFVQTSGARYWDICVPPPMSFEDWESYAKILRLSAEQQHSLSKSYDNYRRSDWTNRVDHVQQLFDRSAEIAAGGVNNVTVELATQRVELFQARNRVLPYIANIEQVFFTNLAQFLADSQLERLDIVRLMRQRANDRRFSSTFPGFRFDLDGALLSLEEAGEDLTPADPRMFEQLRQAWRVAASSLYARHAEETRQGERGLLLRAESHAAYERGESDLGDKLLAEFIQIREPATRTARQILDLHSTSVRLVAEQLPLTTRRKLQDDFARSAYKPLFPDRCDLTVFFESILQSGLAPDPRQRVEEIREGWRATDDVARERVMSCYLDWNETTCTKKSSSKDEYVRYSNRMESLIDARIAAAEVAVTSVLDVMPKAQRREADRLVDRWRTVVAKDREERKAIKAHYGGWPAPFE